MQVLRDEAQIANLEDPDLRALIQARAETLLRDFDDMALHELVTFVVVEPGDSLQDLEGQLRIATPGVAVRLQQPVVLRRRVRREVRTAFPSAAGVHAGPRGVGGDHAGDRLNLGGVGARVATSTSPCIVSACKFPLHV
jgi:hypothetical protein